MDAPDPIILTPVFHAAVGSLCDRLGPHVVVADSRWQGFAEAAVVGAAMAVAAPPVRTNVTTSTTGSTWLVVGPSAFVLRHAATTDCEFGFVIPVARSARRWQRVASWRDDATMSLWKAGWSPVAIDRVVVADEAGTLEFVIGNARPTPTVATTDVDGSALDDGD